MADVIEEECYTAPIANYVNASVSLHRAAAGSPGVTILGVDTGGDADERPKIAWFSADRLRVTVPNLSVLKVLTQTAGPVSVDVVFDPPDPAARTAWLKHLSELDREIEADTADHVRR